MAAERSIERVTVPVKLAGPLFKFPGPREPYRGGAPGVAVGSIAAWLREMATSPGALGS